MYAAARGSVWLIAAEVGFSIRAPERWCLRDRRFEPLCAGVEPKGSATAASTLEAAVVELQTRTIALQEIAASQSRAKERQQRSRRRTHAARIVLLDVYEYVPVDLMHPCDVVLRHGVVHKLLLDDANGTSR